MGDLQDFGDLAHFFSDHIFWCFQNGRAERKRQIIAHRQMGIERILLENHRNIPLRRRILPDIPATNMHAAAVQFLKARNQTQRCGLPGTGRAQQDDKGTVLNGHGDIVNSLSFAKGFGDILERNFSHATRPR